MYLAEGSEDLVEDVVAGGHDPQAQCPRLAGHCGGSSCGVAGALGVLPPPSLVQRCPGWVVGTDRE